MSKKSNRSKKSEDTELEADDKRSARLNCISHLLSMVPYERVPFELPDLPKRRPRPDRPPGGPVFAHVVPQRY